MFNFKDFQKMRKEQTATLPNKAEGIQINLKNPFTWDNLTTAVNRFIPETFDNPGEARSCVRFLLLFILLLASAGWMDKLLS